MILDTCNFIKRIEQVLAELNISTIKDYVIIIITHRLMILTLPLKENTVSIQLFDALRSGIKLSKHNMAKMLFCKHRVNMNHPCGVKIETQLSL